MDNNKREFLKTQRDIEIFLGHYSPAFGSDLLLGMVVQPCFPEHGNTSRRWIL
jgi:hypothetical protein